MSDVIATGKNSGVKLESYKDVYSLSAQNENKGKYWPVWAKYKKGKDGYQDKDWPVKITLGNKEMAIATLTMLLKEISGLEQQQQEPSTSPNRYPAEPSPEDDVPF
jgi:hypothetical protein